MKIWWLAILVVLLLGCQTALERPQERPLAPSQEAPTPVAPQPPAIGTLRVIFADVGQGGAVIIQTPDDKTIIYDCGQYKDRIYDDLRAFGVGDVDLLIASHADADHIGACKYILQDHNVTRVVDNNEYKETNTYIEYETYRRQYAKEFFQLLGDGLDPVFPFIEYHVAYDDWGNFSKDANDNSVVVRLVWGDTSFLLTGDCEAGCEKTLTDTTDIDADVLDAGHHGSRGSSTDYALKEITPRIVIISAGKDNRYGHPHEEALDRIRGYTDNILRTDQKGTIVVETDGKTLKVTNKDGLILWQE
ncbi:MBL fold metallo-hydrolase [Candidatus Woesearchaeota archaeon]|nr:MBL fold metallo-hydrolase [Candidatus Woesearchaeota archaeon]